MSLYRNATSVSVRRRAARSGRDRRDDEIAVRSLNVLGVDHSDYVEDIAGTCDRGRRWR